MSNENQKTSVSSEIIPSVIEQQYRVEALGHAVRHRLSTETPDNIVEAAEKYFTFLQGTK